MTWFFLFVPLVIAAFVAGSYGLRVRTGIPAHGRVLLVGVAAVVATLCGIAAAIMQWDLTMEGGDDHWTDELIAAVVVGGMLTFFGSGVALVGVLVYPVARVVLDIPEPPAKPPAAAEPPPPDEWTMPPPGEIARIVKWRAPDEPPQTPGA